MDSRFEGKVILITGAASGIGRATAITLAEQGARLALTDINLGALIETITLCTGSTHDMEAFDIGSAPACAAFVRNIVVRLGRVDHVFNCAGINPTPSSLTDTTDAYWDALVNANLRGTYNMTRAAIPFLQPGSSIVNVSSTLGLTVAAGHAIYCATKWGIVGFTKAMAMELGQKQIRVNAVAPGFIETPTNAGIVAGPAAVREQMKQIPLGRMGTPYEVADVVAFLFSDEAKYMSGSIVEITGGKP